MTDIKEQLTPLLLPYVIAERDAVNAVMKNYLDWDHITYSSKDADPDGTVTFTRRQLNVLWDGFFYQAGVCKDQIIMMEVLVHQMMRILYDAGLVDEMPKIDTCMVGQDGRPRIGGSCTGGGGGW